MLTCSSVSIPWGCTSGRSLTLRASQGLAPSSPSPTHQSRNWDICLRIRAWVWGARVIPSEATDRLARSTKPASFPSLYLRTLGESWVMYPRTSFPWSGRGHQQRACPDVRQQLQAQSAPTCSCQGVGAETPPQGRLGQALLPTAHPQDEHADIEGDPQPVEDLGQQWEYRCEG